MAAPPVSTWRCTVCGYVHRDAVPPAFCPHCGVDKSAFEPYGDEPRPALRAARWRCIICGHEHSGPEPPESCPVCGAPNDHFEQVLEAPSPSPIGKVLRVVVVGAGVAGLTAAEAVIQASPGSPIVLISREDDLPYFRLNLTRYLAGEISEEELTIHPRGRYEEQGIDLRLGAEVAGRYFRFLFRDGNLVGAVLLSDSTCTGAAKQAVERKTDFSALVRKRPGGTEVARHLSENGG